MERVTRELEQTSERLEEAERVNQRYQRELESVEGLHHKVNLDCALYKIKAQV